LNELTSTGSLVSGLSGDFSFVAPAGYYNFVIAFKSGQGVLDPDWAAFILPAGVTSGNWSISGAQALSHVNLYGQVCPTSGCPDPGPGPGPGQTPIPGAAFLMGSVLAGGAGFGAWRRRRRAVAK
jgi:hypothetical protein